MKDSHEPTMDPMIDKATSCPTCGSSFVKFEQEADELTSGFGPRTVVPAPASLFATCGRDHRFNVRSATYDKHGYTFEGLLPD